MKSIKTLFGIFTITTALMTQSKAQSFLTNGLVAYYPFNGNANDASGNGNNGIVTGAILAQDRIGNSNSAYAFDGVESVITIPSFAQAEANAHTISAWVQAKSWTNINTSAIYVDILGKDNFNSGPRQWVCQGKQTGQIRWAVFTSTGEYDLDSIQQLRTNQWYQVVTVWDGTNESVFINGSFDSSISAPGALVQGTAPVRIGGNPIDGPQYFAGKIDDVRIYNVAFSPSQVQQLYASELGPRVNLLEAVTPLFSNLTLTTNYQLQVSSDLNSWTNQGVAFTATNATMTYPQYFNVPSWNQLFFRLQVVP